MWFTLCLSFLGFLIFTDLWVYKVFTEFGKKLFLYVFSHSSSSPFLRVQIACKLDCLICPTNHCCLVSLFLKFSPVLHLGSLFCYAFIFQGTHLFFCNAYSMVIPTWCKVETEQRHSDMRQPRGNVGVQCGLAMLSINSAWRKEGLCSGPLHGSLAGNWVRM